MIFFSSPLFVQRIYVISRSSTQVVSSSNSTHKHRLVRCKSTVLPPGLQLNSVTGWPAQATKERVNHGRRRCEYKGVFSCVGMCVEGPRLCHIRFANVFQALFCKSTQQREF